MHSERFSPHPDPVQSSDTGTALPLTLEHSPLGPTRADLQLASKTFWRARVNVSLVAQSDSFTPT